MNCIIVDDEPVARKGMKSLIEQVPQLELAGSFNNAVAASAFMSGHTVELILLDIQMPGITGLEFAQSIPENTQVILTTAYADYLFIKSERRYFKINFSSILFIEGLKDYSILQLEDQRIITKMNLKNIHEQLPDKLFLRVNKSYIVNTSHIDSFDTNDVYIKTYEIALGGSYKRSFFEEFMPKYQQKE